MTTNKEEALRKYLARKGDSLNAAQNKPSEDLQKKGPAPPTPPPERGPHGQVIRREFAL